MVVKYNCLPSTLQNSVNFAHTVLSKSNACLKIGLSYNYPLKRGQEPLIRDVRPRWLPFSQVSLSEQHLRLIVNPKSMPFYTPTGY